MPRAFSHPSVKDFTIDGVLYALSDPLRRNIVAKLMDCRDKGMSCAKACEKESPSTISFHHKILRESGLIKSEKRGVEVINFVRYEEMNKRFPGLLETVLRHHKGGKNK